MPYPTNLNDPLIGNPTTSNPSNNTPLDNAGLRLVDEDRFAYTAPSTTGVPNGSNAIDDFYTEMDTPTDKYGDALALMTQTASDLNALVAAMNNGSLTTDMKEYLAGEFAAKLKRLSRWGLRLGYISQRLTADVNLIASIGVPTPIPGGPFIGNTILPSDLYHTWDTH